MANNMISRHLLKKIIFGGLMPNLTMPNLDKLYREEGLRNSQTMIDGSPIDCIDAFDSIRDFKREVRGLLLVPYIVTRHGKRI